MKYAYALAAPIALACTPAMGATFIEGPTELRGILAPFQATQEYPDQFFETRFSTIRLPAGQYSITIDFDTIGGLADYLFVTSQREFYGSDPNGPVEDIDSYDDFYGPSSQTATRARFLFDVYPDEYHDEYDYFLKTFVTGTGLFLRNPTEQPLGFTVTLSTQTGAVPEPSTWALLILGFGAIGGAMRSRRRVKVSYA